MTGADLQGLEEREACIYALGILMNTYATHRDNQLHACHGAAVCMKISMRA